MGWVSLHRKIQDSAIYKDSQAVHLWIHLLFKANHKSNEFLMGNKLISVDRGQFVTGRKALSVETGINESKIQRLLKVFEKCQQIEQQTFTKYRLITITNYSQYQDREQQTNNRRTASEQQLNTNNNVNNENNDNNKNTYVCFDDFWNLYPIKKSKAPAKKKWDKLKVTDDLFAKINTHLSTAYLNTDKQYIPHATTYLNQERWNDEVIHHERQQRPNQQSNDKYEIARQLSDPDYALENW